VAGFPNEFDVIPFTRFGNQARSILNILRNVLSETQRKNWNCLSPAQPRSKMGKPASAGISNRNYPNRIEMPFTPPQADGVLKRHSKDSPRVKRSPI
jgi:hypothetical protein